TLKTSSLSSILTIPLVRRITFIESVEQVVAKKLANDLIQVLKEANQVINPKLLELADSKSGGYGRHRGTYVGEIDGGLEVAETGKIVATREVEVEVTVGNTMVVVIVAVTVEVTLEVVVLLAIVQ
ncbi:unnamed protein product, partial [Heterotrigona itama]